MPSKPPFDQYGTANSDTQIAGNLVINPTGNADGNEQVGNNLTVGSTTPLGSAGAGVIEMANAVTVPSVNTPGGLALYAQGGLLKARNATGLTNVLVGGQGGITAAVTINTTGEQVLQTLTVPANDPAAGAIYHAVAWGVFTTTGTQGTITFTSRWGGVAGTAMATSPAITWTASLTNAPFKIEVWLNFLTATSVQCVQEIDMDTSTATAAAAPFVFTPSAPVTVTITSPQAWVLDVTESVASQSISMLAGFTERLA